MYVRAFYASRQSAKLRSSYHVRAKTHARHPCNDRPVFNVRPLFLLQPFLFSRRFQRFPVWELTQVKKRARRTVGCVCVRGLDDRRDVRMRGPAIDDEEAWDDQHSLFSILEAPNCHKKKITRAHDIVVRACIPRLSQSFLLEPRQRGSSSSSSTISPTTTVRTTS